ncbi:tubulin binding cofactor A-domain-containing protein [Infundibulicybe gibba]|nr:tubulin binding cofactor A-domain-containing protein [Infundibulicybe gibba]
MSDATAISKQLRIKSGVAERVFKEHKTYLKEAEDQQRKLDKFIADGAEEWDIKNATRMMEESNKMIVDSTSRMAKALDDLQQLVTSSTDNKALADDANLLKARDVLKEMTSQASAQKVS